MNLMSYEIIEINIDSNFKGNSNKEDKLLSDY